MDPVEITAGELLLRAWRPDDIDAVHRACLDPVIQRWTSLPSPYERHDAERFITEVAPAGWADGSRALLGVFDRSSGDLLGSCGLIDIDQRKRLGEIGYWTAPWARRRGVAVQAARAVAGWAFATLDLARISWRAEVGNHASRLVALRTGFTIEGVLRARSARATGRADDWIGSLLPGELIQETPASLGRGSVTARRAAIFGAAQPTLPVTTGSGEQITVRPLRPSDAEACAEAARDPETVTWTGIPHPYEEHHAHAFIGRYAPRRWAAGEGAVAAMADPTGAFAGTIELRFSPVDPAVADVGFMAHPSYRGRGYSSAALRALAHWGLTELGLQRVEWRAHTGNDASRRVAEKAGFTIEGTARAGVPYRGERQDAWVGALVAADLPAAGPDHAGTPPGGTAADLPAAGRHQPGAPPAGTAADLPAGPAGTELREG